MIAYVNENYYKDIYLIDLAEHFNFSSGYISALFKKITNENFKDYLNIKRVEKSKEVMRVNRHIKIKDLSTNVGCNNVNTFIRMFKNYEGISPSEYLETLEKND